MGVIVVLLIVAVAIYYTQVYNSPNAKAVRKLTQGKNEEQKKTIEYFCKEGCMAKTISDDEYLEMVRRKRDSMNFKQKALNKIGLDEEEVSEISPAMFEGFVYKNAYAKQNASGKWVSSAYQVSWIFFSSSQVIYLIWMKIRKTNVQMNSSIKMSHRSQHYLNLIKHMV